MIKYAIAFDVLTTMDNGVRRPRDCMDTFLKELKRRHIAVTIMCDVGNPRNMAAAKTALRAFRRTFTAMLPPGKWNNLSFEPYWHGAINERIRNGGYLLAIMRSPEDIQRAAWNCRVLVLEDPINQKECERHRKHVPDLRAAKRFICALFEPAAQPAPTDDAQPAATPDTPLSECGEMTENTSPGEDATGEIAPDAAPAAESA